MAITIGTHEQVVIATMRVSKIARQRGAPPVIGCPNPADAASPVTIHYWGGTHSKPIGQSADYRHDLSGLPAIYDAELVQGWWDNDAQEWYSTTTADEAAVEADVRRQIKADEDRDAELRERAKQARRAADAKQYTRDVAAILADATQLARETWPGEYAAGAWLGQSGQIVIGRFHGAMAPEDRKVIGNIHATIDHRKQKSRAS